MKVRKIVMTWIWSLVISVAAMSTYAAPAVTDVTAKQRFPWNGLVDITCNVTGIDGTTNGLWFSVAAVTPDSDAARKALSYWVVQGGMKSTDCAVHTNGNYRLLWDAQADLGQVIYSNLVVRVTLGDVRIQRIQLWEGGPYLAATNIGADKPWESGYYFWWGDTIGYKREGETWGASDGSSSNFSFSESNTPTFGKSIASLQSGGWITADNVLTAEHDAAHVHWGGSWRMPTQQELNDLNNKCDWTWTAKNGVNGYVVSGRGDYASASIFLPCAGYGLGPSLGGAGSSGGYWSSVPGSDYGNLAWGLGFNSGSHDTNGNYYRFSGCPVRPVQGFTK